MKTGKAILAATLIFSLASTGCTAKWLSVALADLPVLVQMALNIGGLVTTVESGKQLTATEIAAIQNISVQATKDLTLLQALYNEYEKNPGTDTLQKIQAAIVDIQANLPALLAAAHIADPLLAARVTAAVELVLATVAAFAQLIPPASKATQKRFVLLRAITRPASGQATVTVPTPQDLRQRWNDNVCYGSAACTVR